MENKQMDNMSDLIVDKELDKAVDRAVSYVNIKPRTKHQVMKYLSEKGFDKETAVEATKRLEEYHYIDDMEFCRLYFSYGFDKGRGISRIKRELAEKGVESGVIDAAYEELETVPDQTEMAMEIGRSVILGIDTEELTYEENPLLISLRPILACSLRFSS